MSTYEIIMIVLTALALIISIISLIVKTLLVLIKEKSAKK